MYVPQKYFATCPHPFCSQWKQDANLREIKVMRRYHIQNREDYSKYNKLCGSLRAFAHRLAMLPAADPFRTKMEGQLLNKLYDLGVLNTTAKLSDVDNKLTVAAFCRRRLAVVVCAAHMTETVSAVSLSILTIPFRRLKFSDRFRL
jgi:U3 small nucleolar ribonucleoprotein protein IMP3